MLEESYTNEINNHINRYNNLNKEFNEKATKLEEQLIEKQGIEMKNCIDYFETGYPNIKFSSKLLDYRIKEANLVKQERYIYFYKIYRSSSSAARS